MDCLIFDSSESPIFRPLGSAVLVPIGGISVAVEVNSGENTTYTKVIKDASKLTLLRRLAVDRLARASTPQSHIPLQASPSKMSADERVASIQRHQLHDLEPLSLIFVEDLKGSLEGASNRVAAHNLKVGQRFSVDGLFVLKQGFAMHVDPNRTGWVHQRTTGSEFAYLEEAPGQVLLKLQSVLLTHLYLAGKTYPSSFDPYVSKEGTAGEQIKRSVGVAGQEYLDQAAGNVDIRS